MESLKIKTILITLFFSLPVAKIATAQNLSVVIYGTVSDSITGDPLPYASIQIENTAIGTISDGEGRFTFSVPTNNPARIEVSYPGYGTKYIALSNGLGNDSLKIMLFPKGTLLGEAKVTRRERYKKRGNPAVEFAREVIAARDKYDPRKHDYYQYKRYEKILFAMDDYERKPPKKGKTDKFYFLNDFVDTLETGEPILPISEKETDETVFYQKSPKREKRLINGYKSSGIDEILSAEGVKVFLEETLKEVDIFQNNIPLFLQRFVSPLSTIGPNYYKYYLLDTLMVGTDRCIDLGFAPFNAETFGFTGHLYVTVDSTFFVRKASLNVPKDINLNFVSSLLIEQEYERVPGDSTRITTRDDMRIRFKLFEKNKGMYARRLNLYSRHNFEKPTPEQAQIFQEAADVLTAPDAYNRTEEFWADAYPGKRDTTSTGSEANQHNVADLMKRLRSVPAFYITEKIISVLVSGYIPTHKEAEKNKFEFGPMNSTINGNAIEGARFRIGGATTPQLHKRLFFDGYAAYGTKDRKFKYDALIEYSFIDRQRFRKEYPIHSLRFEYLYDLNKLGQQYMYTSKDNIMLTIRRQKDTRATYLRQAELTYTHEYLNGFAYSVLLRNRREYATPYAPFMRIGTDGTASHVGQYDMTQLEINLRYAHNEKFFQTRNNRIPVTFDAPIFNLTHVMAQKDWLGSSYTYHRTDIGAQKRFWFSAFGYINLIVKAGKVWTKVPYPLLILPNANLTYTIQPENYTNMNALEFINDEYASWDITYYLNGNLLNRIPFIRRLQWREVFSFRGLWGHLSSRNDPTRSANPEGLYWFPEFSGRLGRAPYMEASVGLENIFKFLRVDYVWRLNYHDRPNIQTRGIRMTMDLSF